MNLTTSDLADRLILLCDAEGNILQRAGAQRSSWTTLIGESTLFDELVEQGKQETINRWNDSVSSGESFQIPARYVSPTTRTQTLLLTVSPWQSRQQNSLWVVVAEAISTTILDAPQEFALGRAVMETAVDAIITIDEHGLIHSVNPAASRMFGYSPEELLGCNISMLMPEPYRAEHDDYLATYMRNRKRSIIGIGRRVTGRRNDGREFPIHLAVSEFEVSGKTYFTGMIRDLSELDHVQKQLLQSERLAAIGQMVTGLAHESRNALQRAQGCLDMLALDLADEPDQLDLARRAAVALQQLHRLYEEVRGYAAPIHLEFRGCRLSSIWRKEWDHLQQSREDKEISLSEEIPTDSESLDDESSVDFCEVDIHRMEQVFRNILENAIHACGTSGTVSIRCQTIQIQGETAVEVCVTDDGAGMSAAAAGKIFEPFFTTKQKGTGLGMAIVHRIMNAHRGQIEVLPVENGGTKVRFVLPRVPGNRNNFR